MSDPPTPLTLPSNLPYSITITRLVAPPGKAVKRGDPLLEYVFTSDTSRRALASSSSSSPPLSSETQDARENDMIGTWESGIAGEVTRWDDICKPGSKLDKKHAGYV